MPEGVKREGEAQEGPQLLTGIAKLGKRSTFLLLGQQATLATDEPQRRPLCVFDYKIKLRCGRKLAVPGTVQQTIAYCPTLHIRAHTHTLMWSNCSSEQLFGAYHLVKRIRFARQRRQRRFVMYVGKTIRLPCMCSTVCIRMCVCSSVCVSVYKSTNLLPTAKLREDRQLYPLSAHNFCMS